MTTHYIIMSSSYSKGKRIALHLPDVNLYKIRHTLAEIKEKCGSDASVTVQIVNTDSPSFSSVQKFDMFFEGVEVIETLEEFIKLIKKDRKLKGIDIAKYILSIVSPCKHLTLEKLTYFCYADYMASTGKKLFEDKIYAYMHGPIVNSIYVQFRHRGTDDLSETKEANSQTSSYSSAKSRILFADDGNQKLRSIDETLKKYAQLDAWDLVKLTHRTGSPWQRTQQSTLISDDDIKNFHYVEEI